jgi:ABC-type transport system involved in cytochrome c biogenesis permease component
MDFNNIYIWPLILALCSLALFIEAALLVHVLVSTRQAFWRYLLVVIPLAVSALSFAVAWNTLNLYENLPPSGLHLDPTLYHMIKAMLSQAISASQVQAGITVAVFIAMQFVERKMLPRADQPPVWTLTRGQLLRR